jgi:hypothetical protein
VTDVHEFEVNINRGDDGRLKAELTVDGEDIGGVITRLSIDARPDYARVSLDVAGRGGSYVSVVVEPASPLWFKGELADHTHRVLKALAKPTDDELEEARVST